MSDKAFSSRLNQACDGHPEIPPYGQGRQTWIKDRLGVSAEAVRKYFQGIARPRPGKMKELARMLEVDEAWLSLGIIPDMQPAEKKVRNAEVTGAVNVLAGLIQMNGGHVAFPSDKDHRAGFVDLYAIVRGQQLAIHVALGQQVSPDVYRFTIPKEYDQCVILGAVHVYAARVHYLNLTNELVNKHKVRRGGYYEITINKDGSDYWTGKDHWPRIQSFTDRF